MPFDASSSDLTHGDVGVKPRKPHLNEQDEIFINLISVRCDPTVLQFSFMILFGS